MNRVSICFIIPYYKVSLHLLARCVESVRALGDRADWEIRLVDDGTPGHEAEQYLRSLEDSRIHYLYQENKGLGAARNRILETCEKEYIHFLDADDYLFTTQLIQATDLLDRERPDLLAFGFKKVYDESTMRMPEEKIAVTFRGSGTAYMLRHNLHGAAWGYFFRRKTAGDLRFIPEIYHEDEDFTPLLWLRMQHVIVTTLPVYAYYQRPGSIVNDTDPAKIRKRYDDLNTVLCHLREKTKQLPPVQARALRRRTDMVAMAAIYMLMKESPDRAFLYDVLERMRRENFYPLPRAHWSPLYVAFRLCTLCPALVSLLGRTVFHRKRRTG